MSAYNITGFLRTAYRPFAYCVPPKHPLILGTKPGGGGGSPSFMGYQFKERKVNVDFMERNLGFTDFNVCSSKAYKCIT